MILIFLKHASQKTSYLIVIRHKGGKICARSGLLETLWPLSLLRYNFDVWRRLDGGFLDALKNLKI
jgi:hypothetical protein